MSIIQYVGVVIGYINTVILYPNYLDSDQYGLTRILLFVTIVISQFAQFGTPNMIIRFYPFLKKRILAVGLWVCAAGLMFFLGWLFLLEAPISTFYQDKSILFVEYFYLLVPFSISMVLYNLFDAYLKALYKNILSASMPFVLLRLVWMALIFLYADDLLSFREFIIAYSWSYCLITFITLSYIIWLKALPEKWAIADVRQLKQISNFNAFNLLSGISSFLITKIDVLMLGGFEGLTTVAVYTIAVSMSAVIRIPSSAIARTAPSLIAESFKSNNIRHIQDLYKKSAINQFILSSVVFLLIGLNYDLLLSFLPTEYAMSFILFIYLGMSQVVDTGVGVNGYIMVNSKYYRVDAVLSIFLLATTIISNLILIPIMGAVGAALATVISISLYNILRWAFLRYKMKLNPFTEKNILAVIVLFGTALLIYVLPISQHIWIYSITRSVLFLLITLPAIYYTNMSPELNSLARNLLKQIRKIVIKF